VASTPQAPSAPRVGVTAATISFGVLHKKGPPRLKGAQIAPTEERCWSPPVTSTPKASTRFATFLCEISAIFLSKRGKLVGVATHELLDDDR
jgi:hypothetical protein